MDWLERDVTGPGDRVLHTYADPAAADPASGDRLPVLWLHGTPNTGAPPRPLVGAAAERGLFWVGYDRPGYGGSTPLPGRSVGSAAADVRAIADALGLDRFAVMGHSGGGPHALACAALLPERVLAAVSISGMGPDGGPGLDWFDGLAEGGAASLRASLAGRGAKEAFEAAPDPAADIGFVAADQTALDGEWGWFIEVVRAAQPSCPAALIDDDLAYVAPWGFDPARIEVPVLLMHGADDGMVPPTHSRWLAGAIPGAEVRIFAGEGHVSVMRRSVEALDWLAGLNRRGSRPQESGPRESIDPAISYVAGSSLFYPADPGRAVTDTRHPGERRPANRRVIPVPGAEPACEDGGMAKDSKKRALPDDDVKRKFREALERKQGGAGVDVSDTHDHGKVDHAHGPEAHQKMFRRKSGG